MVRFMPAYSAKMNNNVQGDSDATINKSCSKLTMSLVNDSLKIPIAVLQIHCNFLLIKCEKPLQCKGFSLAFYQQK